MRVNTKRGVVVLASDVSHFYENMETYWPFPTCVSVAKMIESFDLLRSAAPSMQHIVPGHDPLVMRRYPAPSPELEGIVARLDVPLQSSDSGGSDDHTSEIQATRRLV